MMTQETKKARKLPSQRKPQTSSDSGWSKLAELSVDVGIPIMVEPKKWMHDPEYYWDIMHGKVERSLELIKMINIYLDAIEAADPEGCKMLPWYESRQEYKKNPWSDDRIRLELLLHHQRDFSKIIFRSRLVGDYASRNVKTREVYRNQARKQRAKKKAAKLAALAAKQTSEE